MPTILEMAILSMDAYEKVAGGLNETGGVGQFSAGAEDSGASGYFAQAYTFSGGTVIAYRGTDSFLDVITGWPGGFVGSSSAQQYINAAQFYQELNGHSVAYNANIYVTGHSLGGGMAGLVGALYGVSATLFDNINFMGAAQDAWDLSRTRELATGIYGPENAAIQQIYYAGTEPPYFPPNAGSVEGYYLGGEVAEIVRLGNWQPQKIYTPFAGTDPGNLHDVRLLVLTMYGNSLNDKAWFGAGQQFYRAIFSDEIAVSRMGQNERCHFVGCGQA